MTLGSIVAGLGQSELQAICDLEKEPNFVYLYSVNHLVRVITGISVILGVNHSKCNPMPGLLERVKALLSSTDPLTAEQIARLRKQRGMLGIMEVVNESPYLVSTGMDWRALDTVLHLRRKLK